MKKMALILLALLFITACADHSDPKLDPINQEENNHLNENEQPENNLNEENENNDALENKEDDEQPDANEETNSEPQYEIDNDTWSIVPINESNEQVVLITIDDAPDDYALDMAETLEQLDVPAIFFVNGHFLETEEEKDTLKKIHDMGFEIGNHTYSHKNLADLSQSDQKEEIVQVSDMVEDIIGERPTFFRPPHGVYTDYAKEVIEEEDMYYMNWTYGYDWNEEYMTEEAIKDIMINAPELGNGGNLLMHDREWTSAALDDIITGLRDKGYEMVDPSAIKQ